MTTNKKSFTSNVVNVNVVVTEWSPKTKIGINLFDSQLTGLTSEYLYMSLIDLIYYEYLYMSLIDQIYYDYLYMSLIDLITIIYDRYLKLSCFPNNLRQQKFHVYLRSIIHFIFMHGLQINIKTTFVLKYGIHLFIELT